MRLQDLVLVLGLVFSAGTACFTENSCGRGRSVSAEGTTPATAPTDDPVRVVVAESEDRRSDDPFATVSWDVPVAPGGDPFSSVHLHNRNLGHDDGILYVFPHEGPEGGFILSSSAVHDYPTPARTLIEVIRAGHAYLDIHTAAHPEGKARADLSTVNYEDWSSYYCD